MESHEIEHIDLRSDFENENHDKQGYFAACGYHDRLSQELAEAAGDVDLRGQQGYIILAIGSDHQVSHTYFYNSEDEYWNDHLVTREL